MTTYMTVDQFRHAARAAAGAAGLSWREFLSIRRAVEGTDEVTRPNDTEPMGNCGRPIDEECGLKDPSLCVVHGTAAEAPDEDAAAEEARALRRRIARARERARRGHARGAEAPATREQLHLRVEIARRRAGLPTKAQAEQRHRDATHAAAFNALRW